MLLLVVWIDYWLETIFFVEMDIIIGFLVVENLAAIDFRIF